MEPLTPPRPGEPAALPPPTPIASTASGTPGGVRRGLLTTALAIGLLVLGGSAVVFAASPEPSASTTPSATGMPSTDDSTNGTSDPGGTTDSTKPDCPEGADDGSTPSTTPATESPTATPAT
jgi:hypothetical protein